MLAGIKVDVIYTSEYIPVFLEAAVLLAALTHPSHLVRLSSWAEFLCRLAATPMSLGITEDPDAVIPHVRICVGAAQ